MEAAWRGVSRPAAFPSEFHGSCCQLCRAERGLGAGRQQRRQQHRSGSSLFFKAIVPPSVSQHLFCLCSRLFARTIRVALVYLFSLMASGSKWLSG